MTIETKMKMLQKFNSCLILLFLAVFVQGQVVFEHGQELIQPGPPDTCFKIKRIHRNDLYHKDVPSPEGGEFQEQCQSWKNLSCCTLALREELNRRTSLNLYNFTRNLCGALSSQCFEYIRNQECFFWCEPMLRYFQRGADESIQNMPICMEYCDAWFDACKNDYTCFDNWLENFDVGRTLTNCSAPYTCRTFREVYGNGKGLCNTIWGTDFVYSTDTDNCTVMAFNSSMPNPNFKLTFPRSGGPSKLMFGSTLMYVLAVLIFLLITSGII